MISKMQTPLPAIELWGGLEGTVNRVGEQYFSQMERSGHLGRAEDLDHFAALGIRALRYPVLWECVAPDGLQHADWRWTDERLAALRELGVEPIAGLVHHGSGPRHTSLTDPGFAEQLAGFAGAVARRYPWLEYYTPVNEPLTTARFSGLYGVWYPHGRDDATFLRALVNQCRAVVLSMQAIRAVNPHAKLVQTDDLGKSHGTAKMAPQCDFYNQRRWLSWDLLCGMVDRRHPLWTYLVRHGVAPDELHWFIEHPCPPDIIGVNYYVTSERWLDHRRSRYWPQHIGGAGFADIEAARALATPLAGIGPLLDEVWQRYQLPIAITETHIDSRREDQLRWLMEIWQAAQAARQRGIPVRAVTVWALLGSYDWNCLVTQARGYYETGAFDLRSTPPRATAVAGLMRELASGREASHPVLAGKGWWRREGRFFCPPVSRASPPALAASGAERSSNQKSDPLRLVPKKTGPVIAAPILIVGSGVLSEAFGRFCAERDLAHAVLDASRFDSAERSAVDAAIMLHRPWAIINVGDYDGDGVGNCIGHHSAHQPGQSDAERCRRDNLLAPTVLAAACASHGLRLLTFSSERVFDASKPGAYVESDPVAPRDDYGRHKIQAERRVLSMLPQALVVRSGALFSPWGEHDEVARPRHGADPARRLSPTYVPDLVHACLDLLIDGAHGLWHMSHGEALTARELAARYRGIEGAPGLAAAVTQAQTAGALGSERGMLLGPLDDALRRYLQERTRFHAATAALPPQRGKRKQR